MVRLFALLLILPNVCVAADLEALFLGDSGHHQPKARFDELQPILGARGIQITYTDDVSQLSLKNLQRFDAVMLYANIDQLERQYAEGLLSYVVQGGGFIPLHCASYCFRNQPDLVALMGAQFKSHSTGVFQAQVVETEHPITRGYGGFRSWDETYVHHLHNEANRTVLEYRVDKNGREPWTWIRSHGKGRVFYTASGHDSRTWMNPGFQNLVERGIRWAAKRDPAEAGQYLDQLPFVPPAMTEMAADRKPFEYTDVGSQIPNYTPSKKWGVQGKPASLMQNPLSPEESMKHLVVPEGFHVELFAAEPDFKGKPICMAWDERGRLWIAETVDYPNELQPKTGGRDRIRICEDTNGDGRADKFTVFAEGLSIPTSIAFHRGGAVVQNGTETLYLKDDDGDDKADQRTVLVSNWELGDTHGGVSNFQYGLDNWIWAMQGYNNSEPLVNGISQGRFRMGFFRMRPVVSEQVVSESAGSEVAGSEVEFIRSTNNNTWGLGISEEGLVFGSTANGNPSIYMPIANRYYENVRGWASSLTLSSIADTNNFAPITDKVRQVDHHGGYTAAAGHALYTGREFPQEYWNRVAFVNGPTGHLVGSFVLNATGSDYNSTSPFNLLSSDDEWTAPIMAEVGPDGHVWVIDWYNYIVQHNPTPQGFKTGKGRAYETELRDKTHGRIYRIVPDASTSKTVSLDINDVDSVVSELANPTMLVRKHAQRLLVERGRADIADALITLVRDPSTDEIGLNVGAIHALWTMHGIGLLDGDNTQAREAVFAALRHRSAGVRRNAIQVLPATDDSARALLTAKLHQDRNPRVRLAAILALADLPASPENAIAIYDLLGSACDMGDRWIPDAITSAAAQNSGGFLRALAVAKQANAGVPNPALFTNAIKIIERVAEHHARGEDCHDAAELIAGLQNVNPRVLLAVLEGFERGTNKHRSSSVQRVVLNSATEQRLAVMLESAGAGVKSKLVKLAIGWGSNQFQEYAEQLSKELLDSLRDEQLTDDIRVDAARQLVALQPENEDVVVDLLDEVNPRTSPELSKGILATLESCTWEGVGQELVERLGTMTPAMKKTVIIQLLRRPISTQALLDGADQGKVSLNALALDQKQALAAHPNRMIRQRASRLLAQGGSLPNADRAEVIETYLASTQETGNDEKGKLVFKEHCSKCHVHGEMGVNVGPNLTGMAVHPKSELLTHILDPSRNVEGNFRVYSLLTVDGRVMSGMLASESRTAIELVDTEGKRKSVLRDDIEQLNMSRKSVMPEGFEKSINVDAMTDLLEFLTTKGKFLPLTIDEVATAISTKGLFGNTDDGPDRMVFPNWDIKTFRGVPFQLTDPQGKSNANIILMHGPNGTLPPSMPRRVSLPCGVPAKAIHILGGVGGWNFPFSQTKTVSLIVKIVYADGQTEDHPLKNGVHLADYIRRVDVPGSEFAFALGNQQIRYLSIAPKRRANIESIALVKGDDRSAPIIMAITVETTDSEPHSL